MSASWLAHGGDGEDGDGDRDGGDGESDRSRDGEERVWGCHRYHPLQL